MTNANYDDLEQLLERADTAFREYQALLDRKESVFSAALKAFRNGYCQGALAERRRLQKQ